MGKAKLIMAIAFVLAIACGLVAGMAVMRRPFSAPSTVTRRTPLAVELSLTARENEQMRRIWEDVRGKVDDCFMRAQQAQQRRDGQLLAILSDDQRPKYASVQQEYAAALARLKNERDAAFRDAVQRTEQILSEPQKQRYRTILQSRLGQDRPGAAPDWLSTPTTVPARPID